MEKDVAALGVNIVEVQGSDVKGCPKKVILYLSKGQPNFMYFSKSIVSRKA